MNNATKIDIIAGKLDALSTRFDDYYRDDNLPDRTANTMSEAIALSSPSGRISGRAKTAALSRLSTELFGKGGLQRAEPKQENKRENLLRNAKQLRDFAARGMNAKKYTKTAEMYERQAAELK